MNDLSDAIDSAKAGLHSTLDAQRRAFQQHAPLSWKQRVEALDALLHAVLKYETELVDAVRRDFGNRSPHETRLLELLVIADEIRYLKRRIRKWMRPRPVAVNWQFFPSRARVIYQPLGVVGIIGAWNFPVLLTLSPLANALAAGNHAMVKPSELAPATAEVIRRMLAEAFAYDYVSVVTGGSDISAAFSALPFDHLIFTGSGRVGKLVMRAAADNLTPVTLELGGKSPALVHESFPMAAAADRICSAKYWNAGQTCVAPDYALVPEQHLGQFVAEARAVVSARWPALAGNGDYTHMINAAAWERMRALIEDARAKGAEIVQIHSASDAGRSEGRIIPPTIILNVNDSMRVMQEEIFGPILPVVGYNNLDDALAYINAGPRPLALYYFDHDARRGNHVTERTTSGGVTINDCIFHLPQHGLPFGGVGPSGMGAYHGFDGFVNFSKKKGVLVQNGLVASVLGRFLKPPYNGWTDRAIEFLLRRGGKRDALKRFDLEGSKERT